MTAHTAVLNRQRPRRHNQGAVAFSRSFTGGVLPSGVTLTRASTGRYINDSGVLTSAAIDAARFDYLVNGTYAAGTPALIIEAAGTNLCLRSEELDNASWGKTRTTVTANTVAGPDGLTTADTVTEDTTSGAHSVEQVPTVGAGVVYASVWLKAGTRGFGWAQVLTDGYTKRYGVAIDLSTGVVGTTGSQGSPVSPGYRVENWGNGWYRLIVWATHASGAAGVGFGPSNSASPTWAATAQPSYLGASQTIYAIGAQISLTDMTYMATTTASVTRAAEVGADTIPAGVSSLRFTFDDDSTQDVAVSPGAYPLPTNLNRRRLRGYVGLS